MNERVAQFQAAKSRREPLAVLTAYDYPCARLLAETGVDMVLIGDSLGMVVLGYPDTTEVTVSDMVHHTRAVARGIRDGEGKALILADLPYGTADDPEIAVRTARALVEAGAHAVKLEGGGERRAQITAIADTGIPVMAHIGMQPQRVRIEGGYRMKGKTPEQAAQLSEDARAAEDAGAFALLLELVVPNVAREITAALRIPTIGIGAGPDCDGQVLVLHDVVGLFPWFKPKFAQQRADIAGEIRRSTTEFIQAVKNRT